MGEENIVQNGTKIEDHIGADVYFYNGRMTQEAVFNLKNIIIEKKTRHPRASLFLTTNGGDPNAAYRLVSCLKRYYPITGFSLLSFGMCKSAGTIVAIGASELILSHHGELGPLDVQLTRRDDVFGYNSGMDILSAISSVIENSQMAFNRHFIDICRRGNNNISIKLAAEIATNISTKLFAGIMDQIPPLQLGETQRAMDIAIRYATIIKPTNIPEEKIMHLVAGYPAHNFVIDLPECKTLFTNVREPTSYEQIIGQAMAMYALFDDPKVSAQVASLEQIAIDDRLTALITGEDHEQQRTPQASNDAELGDVAQDSGVVEQIRKPRSKQG